MAAPTLVPRDDDSVYIVEEDFGRIGRCWRETDSGKADRATVISDMYRGKFSNPLRVIAFNTREGWSRDVSHEIAVEVQRRADLSGGFLTKSVTAFVEEHTRETRQLARCLLDG